MDPKRLEEFGRGEDIISKLPDDVLIHILSRLDIKDIVKTSVLSSRWRSLWMLANNLSFDDFEIKDFVNSVNKVLSRYRSKNIQDFCLACAHLKESELPQVTDWIRFAIDHGLCSITIRIDITVHWHERRVRLPQSILTCETLVELRLESDFTFDVPDSMCFPSLKILYMDLMFPDVGMMQKLFRKCLVLEDLSIYATYLDEVHYMLRFDIDVPTLKRLTIWHILENDYFEGVMEHTYVITTRNLEYLTIQDGALAAFVMNGRPPLNEAELDVGGVSDWLFEEDIDIDEVQVIADEANRAMELVRETSLTKILSLTHCTMDALSLVHPDDMPTFPNLIRLELNVQAPSALKVVPRFLERSPNLEVLILDMEKDYISKDFVNLESENVSPCLSFHVKNFGQKSLHLKDKKAEVVRFTLRNGQVLKAFYACIADSESREEEDLQREILMFPRGSAAW